MQEDTTTGAGPAMHPAEPTTAEPKPGGMSPMGGASGMVKKPAARHHAPRKKAAPKKKAHKARRKAAPKRKAARKAARRPAKKAAGRKRAHKTARRKTSRRKAGRGRKR